MAKTRSQTGNITIKNEEEDSKPTLLLKGANNTGSNRITKRKPSVINNRRLPAQQIKVEEDTDTKSLLKSSSESSKHGPKPRVSQEQINQLIHYIVNDNMSITKAAQKKIPLPQNHAPSIPTLEQIENLIRYISQDKMSITQAAIRASIPYSSAHYYYKRYLKDPNHAIPVQQLKQRYTQDQREALIGYIVTDKMSIRAASKKANMSLGTAKDYYRKYFKQQNPDILAPSHIVTRKRCTQEQLNEAMSYIINDKMSITEASRKANICPKATARHYRQYLKDHNMKVPAKRVVRRYTQNQINQLFWYIVDDKMTIKAASKKAKICVETGKQYYRQYLKR